MKTAPCSSSSSSIVATNSCQPCEARNQRVGSRRRPAAYLPLQWRPESDTVIDFAASSDAQEVIVLCNVTLDRQAVTYRHGGDGAVPGE